MHVADRQLATTESLASGSSAVDPPATRAQGEPSLDALRPWIEAETGMDFSGNRLARLREAVSKVLGPNGAAGSQCRVVGDRSRLLERLTAELTVGESFFFRNEFHFRTLREQVFPRLLRENSAKREIRIWSAGCATGEEPYSLAILLDQVRAESPVAQGDWIISILATDLNPEFLDRAAKGAYRPWSFRHTSIFGNRRYFSPRGDFYQLATTIRQQVHFAYLNLVKDVYPSPLTRTLGMDLILFRNVAIYLRPAVTAEIVARFHQALRPGGWLLLGETEISLAPTLGFEVHRFEQATFLRKPADKLGEPLEHLQALAMPVLASVARAVGNPPASMSSLPNAAPLSTPRPSKLANRKLALSRDRSKQPAPGSTTAEANLARIESLIAQRRLVDAERAIYGIAERAERGRAQLRAVRLLLAEGEAAIARRILDACAKDQPLLLEAQLLQASFAEEKGDLAAAEQAYRRALYIDRNCPMAHFHLALVQQRRGQYEAARLSLRSTLKLIASHEAHALVEYGEGMCCGRLKEMAAAMVRLCASDRGTPNADS